MNCFRRRPCRRNIDALLTICILAISGIFIYLIYSRRNVLNLSENNDISKIHFHENDYFIAAVIEYIQVQEQIDVRDTLILNLRRYITLVKECHRYKVDIIVFPEGGLFGYFPLNRKTILTTAVHVPPATNSVIPCRCETCDQDILGNLSCAAIENNVYIAVTVAEKLCIRSDGDCNHDNILLFITEVVFDRNGMIIARYRKHNLYMERWQFGINSTKEPEIVTFTTDFGITFGVMICFDLAFEKPALTLVRDHNITHMIHPIQGISVLPFTPVSAIEAGWSYATDTFVLVSSIPTPIYTLGSGIYFGRRRNTRAYMKYHESSKIIISPVPKSRSVVEKQYPKKFHDLNEYSPGKPRQSIFLVEHVVNSMTTKALSEYENRSTATFSYTSGAFECNVSVTWHLTDDFTDVPNYQLMAYSGPNNHSLAAINHHSEICGLALCANVTAVSCVLPPRFDDSSRVSIVSLQISAVSYSRGGIMIPAAYDSNLVALNAEHFEFDTIAREESHRFVYKTDMRLDNPLTNVVAFGIYRFIDTVTPSPVYTVFDDLINKDIVMDLLWWFNDGSSVANFSTSVD